jgi:subtilase family serine protease
MLAHHEHSSTAPRVNPIKTMAIRLSLGFAMLALLLSPAFAATPKQGTVVGPEEATKSISVTVWLNLHNKAALDSLVEGMYDPASPNFHHFLTMKEYQEEFAPSAKDMAQVHAFLAAHNMVVTSTDQANHFVVAQTTVGDAQKAFGVQINRVMVNGVMHSMADSEATVSDAVAPLVAAVQGLSDMTYRPNVSMASDPETGTPYAPLPLTAVGADGLFFSGDCLRAPELITFTTAGTFPTATYFGNRYGADINSTVPNLPSCGYDAAEIQGAYGLNTVYNHGLNGAGQTIMIVDAFGSNTIVSDTNTFSDLNGLPELTPANFAIFTPNGAATCTATNGCIAGNWQFETSLDVEWAHAVAPGANIVLILGANNSFANLDIANLFAVENGFGNVLSNSFGISEIALVDLAPSELVVENGISEIAAALGINQDISTGDSGDNLALDKADFGINSVSVNANPDSPFATGIGGTSTFLNSNNSIKLQTAWGENFARIANPTPNPPVIPPLFFGFQSGSGGGTSVVYAKPQFQKHIKGKFRQLPDISMNADPNTGVEVILTPDSIPGDAVDVAVVGGTSLACPMFSGFWAIANQAFTAQGGGALGQAAPILYQLSSNAITDVNVTPADAQLNVTGLILNPPTAPTFESAQFLAQPLENVPPFGFVSALFQSSTSTRWDVFTFGTDSSLTTGPGWDNATGLGTPNGMPFINEVVKTALRAN